jgi:DNA-binding LacI/PurR family transcriptional regulator
VDTAKPCRKRACHRRALSARVEFEAESAEAAVDRLLQQKIPFDGIVAASDLIALGGIRALHRKGIEVPRDISVVGYDNMLLSRLSTPTLSTVQQDIPKAGRLLVSKLLDWTGDPRRRCCRPSSSSASPAAPESSC